ncbi:MAG TPA: DNA recombination protein RmuC [Caulobacteraceae bacterium]|jgi:DNA recombination protein RmuC
MNALDLVLLALFLAAVGWAVVERGRAIRAQAGQARADLVEETVKAQAALSANAVADVLVKRAAETFAAQNTLSQEKIAAQLKPVADTLTKFEQKIAEQEKAQARDAGGLAQQLKSLMEATNATQAEARRLTTALKTGAGVQGRWGETMLHNVLERAGMKAGTDFYEQVTVSDADGRAQRPDVLVKLPGGVFVIDSKCSTGAYLEALDAPDDAAREEAYVRHVLSLRGHINTLGAKAYWRSFDSSPEFVVMFVPGDGMLAAAVDRDTQLHNFALDKGVVLVTPASLFALCKAVLFGWRMEQQSLNAKEIAALGAELHRRLATMGGHVDGVGKALASAVGKYNAFVGSLETQVMSQARRFEELKADSADRKITEPTLVDQQIRPMVKLAPPPALTLDGLEPTSAP